MATLTYDGREYLRLNIRVRKREISYYIKHIGALLSVFPSCSLKRAIIIICIIYTKFFFVEMCPVMVVMIDRFTVLSMDLSRDRSVFKGAHFVLT